MCFSPSAGDGDESQGQQVWNLPHLPLPWVPSARSGSSPYWIPVAGALSLLTSHTLPCPSVARAGDHWGLLQLAGIFLLGYRPQALLLTTLGTPGQVSTCVFNQNCWGQKGDSAAFTMGSGLGALQRPQETWRDSAHMLSYLTFTPQTLLAGTKE